MCQTDENKNCEEDEQCQIIFKIENNILSTVSMQLFLAGLLFWKTIQRHLGASAAGFSGLLSPS